MLFAPRMASLADEARRRARARVCDLLSGKWLLDGLIDPGGMAAVYSATARDGTRVAIKMLHSSFASDPETRARFMREGRAANAVGHRVRMSSRPPPPAVVTDSMIVESVPIPAGKKQK
jgi:serine/threonine-protein kinase